MIELSSVVWPIKLLPCLCLILFCLIVLLRSPLATNLPDLGLRILLGLGMALGVQNLLLHDFTFMSNDIYEHEQYLEWLYKALRVPDPTAGFQTYQPPLYYLLALPFYTCGILLGVKEPIEMVRVFSLCCYLFFLFYGLATLRLFVPWKPALYVTASALIIWPISTVMSGKINNEILIYPIFVASVYYLLLWQKEGVKSDIWRSIVLAIVSLAVKTTGVLLLAGVAIVILLCIVARQTDWTKLRIRRTAAVSIVLLALLCAGSNFGRIYYFQVVKKSRQSFIIGNMSDTTGTHWPCRLQKDPLTNYLTFDAKTFISNPFITGYASQGDNHLFWNSLLKTLIFGNSTSRWQAKRIAQMIIALYLAVLAYTFVSMCWLLHNSKDQRWRFFPLLLVSALSIAGLIYLRRRYAVMGFGEARYLHFVLPWLLAALGSSISWHRQCGRKILSWIGLGATSALVVGCLVFLTLQWFRYVVEVYKVYPN